jgi:hypothetical protein
MLVGLKFRAWVVFWWTLAMALSSTKGAPLIGAWGTKGGVVTVDSQIMGDQLSLKEAHRFELMCLHRSDQIRG